MSFQKDSVNVGLPNTPRPVCIRDLIRVGRNFDGGYVLPRRLIGECDAVLSMGISLDWSFEKHVSRLRPGIPIYCYDKSTTFGAALIYGLTRFLYSPISRKADHLRAPLLPLDYVKMFRRRSTLTQKFVGAHEDEATVDISRVFERLDRYESILLKIDIEGAEYEIMDLILRNHRRICGIAIEFHNINSDVFRHTLDAMLGRFVVAHVHANNGAGISVSGRPRLLEVTFVNKERHGPIQRNDVKTYAHPLDMPNIPGNPEFQIHFD